MSDAAPQTVTIEHSVRIAARPETIWAFWTDPARLTEWWGVEAEVEPEPGGLYRVVMGDGPVMRGAITDIDEPRRLVFSFGWEHNAPGEPLAPGSTRVEVTLEPDGDGTVVVLRHSDMPAAARADHAKGWAQFVGERLPAAVARMDADLNERETTMAVQVTTVMLGVEDLDRSKKFYADGLGCAIAQDYPNFVSFDLGEGSSTLGLYPREFAAQDAGVSSEGSGFSGVSLHYIVASREAVDEAIAAAVAAGGAS